MTKDYQIFFKKRLMDGYRKDSRNESFEAIKVWSALYYDLEKYVSDRGITSIRGLLDAFGVGISVHDWLVDFDLLLENTLVSILRMEDYKNALAETADLRLRICDFIIELSKSDQHIYEGNMRKKAQTYYFIGQTQRGKEIYEMLKEKYFRNVWNYIDFSDMYWFYNFLPHDLVLAKQILEEARDYKFDKDEVEVLIERMVEICIMLQKQRQNAVESIQPDEVLEQTRNNDHVEDATPLSRQKITEMYTSYYSESIINPCEVQRKREKENLVFSEQKKGITQSSNIPFTKVKIGRNDPCPCGSGKKFKKCCCK